MEVGGEGSAGLAPQEADLAQGGAELALLSPQSGESPSLASEAIGETSFKLICSLQAEKHCRLAYSLYLRKHRIGSE